ncbi:two-component system response regulator [Scytonema hofmannii PCC 7110]|uniref:Two-component system response regulator n=1 Tax=Scytonema hofmannii PCC 7110 TaxID=128403 RepID=A0A139X5P7_9CYAN|nr:response regulator transcription factor [Scytonema hofmannii]KYC39986.1 two-component system response regulator [Scytonema hofmannii PCC 7110]
MRILVVEDDVQIADMLAEALTNRQYVVDVVQDGETALNYVQTLNYDLILLDITLPKLDGIGFCQQLRDGTKTIADGGLNLSIPILMLTARDTVADKIAGLDAGADDYMVKPFDLGELMARVRALLRRGSSRVGAKLFWGNLCISPSTYEVTYEDQFVNLTPKEYAILELLVSSGRRVLSRPGIIERVWSLEDPPSEETVKSHIKSLRQKLREVGAPDDFIETVHGLGYRLKLL